MKQVGVHSCSDGSHIHITRRRTDEMLDRGEAKWLAEKTGILRRTWLDKCGNKASYAIRGLSCRLGPYILTSSDLDVVLRALVMLRRSPPGGVTL